MAVYHLDCAQLKEAAPSLRAGDRVLLSGTAYTARDAAHKRIAQALEAGEPLPFALEGAVVYYAGPGSFADRELWADDLRPDGCLYS